MLSRYDNFFFLNIYLEHVITVSNLKLLRMRAKPVPFLEEHL